ncbi:MAG: acetyl-CoA carboxylase biotin carboxyl carrier protein subunit [Aliidongia sp.]
MSFRPKTAPSTFCSTARAIAAGATGPRRRAVSPPGPSDLRRRAADRHAGRSSAGSGNELRAEMPGTVVDIACSAGAPVGTGQPLLTVESMKMQMILAAPFDAVVETVHVAPNASFERNALLVTLKPV